ncbi:MAG: hypothetical protein IJ012_05270 [Clostridia bacterium]|nr:hypothetical protein [Clostridia bacterium]
MLHSSITVGRLIEQVEKDMGLYEEIDRTVYFDALNECLCRVYGEVIDERAIVACVSKDGKIAYGDISVGTGQDSVRAGDIRSVRYGEKPLQYLPPDRFGAVKSADGDFYTLQRDGIYLTPTRSTTTLYVTYTVRPQRFGTGDVNGAVPFPNEYLFCLRAKLRGEAYKLVNEDALAAKWLSEYNEGIAAFAAAYGARGGGAR